MLGFRPEQYKTLFSNDSYKLDLTGKFILIIGGGADLNGRNLGTLIDDNDKCPWDYIVRVNKHYGDIKDVGERTDTVVCREASFFKAIEKSIVKSDKYFNLSINGGTQDDLNSWNFLCSTQNALVSTGMWAVFWFLAHGAAGIDIIGFNARDGRPIFKNNKKMYVDGTQDLNSNFNWENEFNWINQFSNVIFL